MKVVLRDAARILGLPEGKVQVWVEQGRLPSYRIGGELRFDRAELRQWGAEHRNELRAEMFAGAGGDETLSMHAALLRGGTHYGVPGKTLEEVLGEVAGMPEIPAGIDRRLLRDLMVAREGLASTGVGRGVAIPHARDPITVHVDKPVVLLCFLREAVDFRAIDGIPVTVLFALLSPGVRPHLRLLARLAWLLHDEPLNRLLAERAPETAILDRVLALEERIGGPGAPPPGG